MEIQLIFGMIVLESLDLLQIASWKQKRFCWSRSLFWDSIDLCAVHSGCSFASSAVLLGDRSWVMLVGMLVGMLVVMLETMRTMSRVETTCGE
jgi:hypothetical protein